MPHAVCGDAQTDWYAQRTVDYGEMAQEAFTARYAALHKDMPYHDGTFTFWAKERSAQRPFHFQAGVTVTVSTTDLTPDDRFLEHPKGGDDRGHTP